MKNKLFLKNFPLDNRDIIIAAETIRLQKLVIFGQ